MKSSSVKIFLHDSVVSPAGQRGVNRYFLKFMQAVCSTYKDRVLIYSGRKLAVPSAKIIAPPSRYVRPDFSYRINTWLTRLDSPLAQIIANSTSEVYYSPYFGQVRTKIPQVYTVPDMIYEKFPAYFPVSDKNVRAFIQEKRECLERAALILPISQSTAQDMLDFYPHLSADRIKVVYLGVDELFFENSSAQKDNSKPYFLYIGNRSLYKNFTPFLKAFGKSGLSREFDLQIVSPENAAFSNPEQDVIREFGLLEHLKIETAVSDRQLRGRYNQAHAFIYPSEYEGFGLPIVEAMASGTLVVTSDTSSMPEIGGDIPLYFNPHSLDSMVETLLSASQMPEYERSHRIQKGKIRAAQFSWQAAQNDFIQAIRSLL
ncbi:MAG: hypothetical protein C0410_13195 [Anaerolinea sp.]|nr:hypothetical protein [Anaerolinea sp.]